MKKKRLVPLIAIVPLAVALYVIVSTAYSGEPILLRDDSMDRQKSLYQTYQSSLALCEDKFGSGTASDEIEYEQCISTVEKWYDEQASPLEKLQNYKAALEETNQYNFERLAELQEELADVTPDVQKRISDEIMVLESVIEDNENEIQITQQRIDELV